jgi:predicted alpha-1,6-mannanase (GH76 family)
VGAAVELYRSTHNQHYLQKAMLTAQYMLQAETEKDNAGNAVLTDGNSCSSDCMSFKGIGVRYLYELWKTLQQETLQRTQFSSSERSQMRALADQLQSTLTASANAAWQNRNVNDLAFPIDWLASVPQRPYYQASQASALMALSVLARMKQQ